MMSTQRGRALRAWLALLAALLCAREAGAATRSIDQHQAADPAGSVDIVLVAGTLLVSGWERSEVAVTGLIGDRIDHVEITSSGSRTAIHVISPEASHWSGDGAARLTIHVPARSALNISLVSADVTLSGVTGAQQIRTVSGDIKSDGGGAARINTVSGNVRLSVPESTAAEIETMSGDLMVTGAGGEVSITTVSGDGHLALGTLHSFRLRTVSGDFSIASRLEPAANFEAESINGDLQVKISGAPGLRVDAQSLSGDIRNCTAPEAIKSEH
ncbi:MAG TPA: DUF4097 family beta strand repeat-containing protein, partial [Steroidobacteraceae bacterium]